MLVIDRYPTYEIGRRYAHDGDWWVRDFVPVLDKMLINKVDPDLLQDL